MHRTRKKSSSKKRASRRNRKGLGNLASSQVVYLPSNAGYGSSDLKWKIIGITLGVSALGVAAFFGYRWYTNSQKGKVEEKSLEIGNPENYAMHLKKAFDNDGWLGTNNKEVFRTFTEMPSYASYAAMTVAYKQLTGNIFEHDLDDEMTLEEVRKIEDILKTKPGAPKSVSINLPSKKTK